MRPPNAHLIGILSALLVLLCLSGSAAQPGGRQDQAGLKIVRKDDSINSQGGSEPTDYGYGPPPPYYSEEPTIAISTDSPYLPPGMPTSQTRTSMTGAGISSEIDGTSMMNVSVSSGDGTVSSGHSSTFVSTAMMTTDTSTVLAGSSAKASSATDSQTASTVHSTGSVASLISEATNGAIPSTTEGGSFDSTSDDGYSFSSTVSSFSGTEPTSDFTSPSDTTGLLTSASLISSSITPPRILTGSETFGEETSAPASSATSESASEATARWNGTSHMSDSSKSLSTDYPAPGQSTLGSSIAARSTTTTTWMTEATQSSDFSGTPSSSEVGTGSLSGLVSSTSLVESTTSMRPITTTTARFNITVTVSRSTSTEPATTLDESEPWPTSTLVTSVPVPVPSQTWSAITSMIIVSSFGDSSGTASAPASTPFITDTSAISLTPSSSSGSFDESGPVVSASLTQTSSSPLFDSSTLPVNTSTQASSMSATMITVTENSVITVFPGEVPPTGTATDVTNSSISTTYETVTSSQHNVSNLGTICPLDCICSVTIPVNFTVFEDFFALVSSHLGFHHHNSHHADQLRTLTNWCSHANHRWLQLKRHGWIQPRHIWSALHVHCWTFRLQPLDDEPRLHHFTIPFSEQHDYGLATHYKLLVIATNVTNRHLRTVGYYVNVVSVELTIQPGFRWQCRHLSHLERDEHPVLADEPHHYHQNISDDGHIYLVSRSRVELYSDENLVRFEHWNCVLGHSFNCYATIPDLTERHIQQHAWRLRNRDAHRRPISNSHAPLPSAVEQYYCTTAWICPNQHIQHPNQSATFPKAIKLNGRLDHDRYWNLCPTDWHRPLSYRFQDHG
ncbi:hypothetical protein ACJ41O_009732 [Fusarium nematophilum]